MKYKEIIIHCSATKAGKDYRAKDIDKWHRARGFVCIGYHYVIDLDGKIEEGRNIAVQGAHCKGYNEHSIGICYIGGLDKFGYPFDTRTEEQKIAIKSLVYALRNRYGPLEVHGHNEYSNKACPCFDVKTEFQDLNY